MKCQKLYRIFDLHIIEEETKKPPQGNAEKCQKRPMYQLLFLGDDNEQSIEVWEVDEVDFSEVKLRLERGESVFMTKRENEKFGMEEMNREVNAKVAEKRWYTALSRPNH